MPEVEAAAGLVLESDVVGDVDDGDDVVLGGLDGLALFEDDGGSSGGLDSVGGSVGRDVVVGGGVGRVVVGRVVVVGGGRSVVVGRGGLVGS